MQLITLNLSSNQLSILPTRLILPALTSLDVSANHLTTIDPHLFDGMPQLQYLFVQDNDQLFSSKSTWTHSLVGLGDLLTLDLSNTGLVDQLPARLFCSLPTLKYANLQSNRLQADVLDQAFLNCPSTLSLVSLNVSSNRLHSIGSIGRVLAKLPTMRQFDFSLNPLICNCSLAIVLQLRSIIGDHIDDDRYYYCFASRNNWQYPLMSYVHSVDECADEEEDTSTITTRWSTIISLVIIVCIFIFASSYLVVRCGHRSDRYRPLRTNWIGTDDENIVQL
jgi:hypothetical protein